MFIVPLPLIVFFFASISIVFYYAGAYSMAKALCIFGMVVAVLVLLVFGLDISLGFPFGKIDQIMDIIMIVSAGILGYVSWTTLKEQQQ